VLLPAMTALLVIAQPFTRLRGIRYMLHSLHFLEPELLVSLREPVLKLLESEGEGRRPGAHKRATTQRAYRGSAPSDAMRCTALQPLHQEALQVKCAAFDIRLRKQLASSRLTGLDSFNRTKYESLSHASYSMSIPLLQEGKEGGRRKARACAELSLRVLHSAGIDRERPLRLGGARE